MTPLADFGDRIGRFIWTVTSHTQELHAWQVFEVEPEATSPTRRLVGVTDTRDDAIEAARGFARAFDTLQVLFA